LGARYTAKAVILATGSAYRELGLPNEKQLSGHGVSWCATCDGFFFRDQHIAVIGGGDSALEEATFLTRFASKVTLVHRRQELRASQAMQDRARADEKLEFLLDSEVAEIHGEDSLTGLTIRNTVTSETSELPVTGMFVAIGSDPRTDLFADQIGRSRSSTAARSCEPPRPCRTAPARTRSSSSSSTVRWPRSTARIR